MAFSLQKLSTLSLLLEPQAKTLLAWLWQPNLAWGLVVLGCVAGVVLRLGPWHPAIGGASNFKGPCSGRETARNALFIHWLFPLGFMLGAMQIGAATVVQTAGPSAIVWAGLAAIPAIGFYGLEIALSNYQLRQIPPASTPAGTHGVKSASDGLNVLRTLPLLGAPWQWLGKLYAGLGLLVGICLGTLAQVQVIVQGLANFLQFPSWILGVGLVGCMLPCLFVKTTTLMRWCASLALATCIIFLSTLTISLLMRATLIPQAIHALGKGIFSAADSSSNLAGTHWANVAGYGLAVGFSAVLVSLGMLPPSTSPKSPAFNTRSLASSRLFLAPFYLLSFGLGTALVILGSHFWLQHQSPLQTTLKGFEHALPALGGVASLAALGLGALAALLAWSLLVRRCLQHLLGETAGLWLFGVLWPSALLGGSVFFHLPFLGLGLALTIPWVMLHVGCTLWAGTVVWYRHERGYQP